MPVGQHARVVEARGQNGDQADGDERLDRDERKPLDARSGRALPGKRRNFTLDGSNRHVLEPIPPASIHVMRGLVPRIHVFGATAKAWMAATSPATTASHSTRPEHALTDPRA